MATNTEMVGKTFGPFVHDYTLHDLELSAPGCGAGIDGKDSLEYINEHGERDPHLRVFPMFGAMLIVDSEVIRIIDYGYNYVSSLHWGFDITFHKPTIEVGDYLETTVRLEELYDRGEGRDLFAQRTDDTYDSGSNLFFMNESWGCLVYDNDWDDPKPPKGTVEMPDRPADVEITETISENQASIYRLSGDYHSQHIDWDYVAGNEEPRSILHVTSYAGIVMRYAINTLVPGEPECIIRFKTRITSLVHPDTTLKTRLWRIKEGELRFILVDADVDETGARPYLNWGIIEYC